MTTRDEIVEAIRAVDARIDGLRERILARPDAPLPEGTWCVRDALSHLAARANGVARVVARAAPRASGAPPAPPPRGIDEINAGQVEERSDRTAAELLAEISAGHAAAIAALAGVDDATLAQEIPMGFRPGDIAVADMTLRGGPGHDGNHLDQVEAALTRS
ncbi:MAG: maleylpyruvate isomerase N-terminal domain-containing protein [Dehalococcoidia bacterium]